MTPLICATVTAATTAELLKKRDAVRGADLVELRLDSVLDPDPAAAISGRRTPVIVTCRPAWEGGHFTGSEAERHRILKQAQDLGADYIDVEHRAGFSDLVGAHAGRGVIASMHDFERMPDDLAGRLRAMAATGAEVLKIAVPARRLSDLVRLDAARREASVGESASRRVVVIGMSQAGQASRILAGRLGSCWTYCGDAAPGQLSLGELVDRYRVREITDHTAVYGVVGNPIGHSLSPALHNPAFRAAGIDAVYLPLEAADADDFLAFADAFGVRGASVTAPFKIDLAARSAVVDPVAQRLGAINTLRRSATGGWESINTDVAGFLAPLRDRLSLDGARAAVIGAGGAARGVLAALAHAGAHATVYARRAEQGEAAASVSGARWATGDPAPRSWDLLVNTTPIGALPRPDERPLPDLPLDGRVVYDLVYNPTPTRLMRDALAAGCDVLGGLDMLTAQARLQWEWWTGRLAPAGTFDAASLGAAHAAHR